MTEPYSDRLERLASSGIPTAQARRMAGSGMRLRDAEDEDDADDREAARQIMNEARARRSKEG